MSWKSISVRLELQVRKNSLLCSGKDRDVKIFKALGHEGMETQRENDVVSFVYTLCSL